MYVNTLKSTLDGKKANFLSLSGGPAACQDSCGSLMGFIITLMCVVLVKSTDSWAPSRVLSQVVWSVPGLSRTPTG